DARCIEEHDLRVRIVLHAEDPIPRRLRLVGDDRELGPDQAIQQCGLAGIRTADEGNEAGFHGNRRSAIALSAPSAGSGLVLPEIPTLWIRRRSTSSTSTLSPSISKRSPPAGTRPMRASR